MTWLLCAWLLLTPAFLLLRRAVDVEPCAPGTARDGVASGRQGLHLSHALVARACTVAAAAHAAGHATSAARLLAAAQAGADVFLPDLAAQLARARRLALAADGTVALLPLDGRGLRGPALRSLAWLERAGHAVLASEPGRLRLRLFVLQGSVRVLRRQFRRLRVPRSHRPWVGLDAARANLNRLTHDSLASLAATPAAPAAAGEWIFAT